MEISKSQRKRSDEIIAYTEDIFWPMRGLDKQYYPEP